MKRFLIVAVVLGVTVGSLTTAEAKKKQPARFERTVVDSYGPYPAPVTGCNEPMGSYSCVSIATHLYPRERFFTAKVTDAHGLPVFVEVRGGSAGVVATFCGETKSPVAFEPGSWLQFHVGLNHWIPSGHCPANRIKTTGTISVTLSNLP